MPYTNTREVNSNILQPKNLDTGRSLCANCSSPPWRGRYLCVEGSDTCNLEKWHAPLHVRDWKMIPYVNVKRVPFWIWLACYKRYKFGQRGYKWIWYHYSNGPL